MDKIKKKIFQNSVQLRGLMLDATVDIERSIDNYLAEYFCPNQTKGFELIETLLHTERITLGSKKDIFFILIRRYNQDFLDKYPWFIKALEDFIPHRNILAHLQVDYSDDILTKDKVHVVFKKYREGKLKRQEYTQEIVDKLFSSYKEIMNMLIELKPPKPPQAESVATD